MDEVVGRATEADWEAWMEVLRDPESRKARKILEEEKANSPRCCLGHLCAISPEVERVRRESVREEDYGEPLWVSLADYLYRDVNDAKDVKDKELPRILAQKFDLTPLGEFAREYSDREIAEIVGVHPDLLVRRKYEDLTELNDDSDLDLAHIAAFIRHVREKGEFKSWGERDEV